MESPSMCVTVRWNGKAFSMRLDANSTIMSLKLHMLDQTEVHPSRQRFMGLKLINGKLASDEVQIKDVLPSNNAKLLMIGSSDTATLDLDEDVVLDFDSAVEPAIRIENQEYLQKIDLRIRTYKFNELSPPRTGRKLLVLDMDYTLFDHKSTVENVKELMRPYLHEFLTAVYQYYDIFIWSATSMKWITAKIDKLGVLSNENYKITALVDYGAMITIHNPKYGIFNAKPLQVIWAHYSNYYSPKTTIMLDDLSRNFITNPKNGLKVYPYKNAPTNHSKDNELQRLTAYLLSIVSLDDFDHLNHKNWKHYLRHQK